MLELFFAQHPVFSSQDIASAFPDSNPLTLKSLLAYHGKQGHLGRIRRGLYYVVPTGQSVNDYPVDPYLVASRLTTDAVLCCHTALSFHGLAYSIRNEFTCFTLQEKSSQLVFQSASFRTIEFPKALASASKERMQVIEQERQGLPLSVTSIERTLVDCLDRIDDSGGIEEVWRSIESISYLAVDSVIKYALALKNSTTTAKVGYFLAQNQEKYMVTKGDLKKLQRVIPAQPHYMLRRKRSGGVLVPEWNLMVPKAVATKQWEEPDHADLA